MHATTSPKAIDLKPAALALVATALFAGGIILGSAMDIRIAPVTASVAAPDTSYNAIEGARAQFGVSADTSYATVESLRAQAGVAVDNSLVGKSGFPSNRSGISSHDQARAAGGWWASAPAVGTPVSQADPDSRYGAGIR